MSMLRYGLLIGLLVVSACVPKREPAPPTPRPQPQIRPQPQPQPLPPPPPVRTDWLDMPLSPGNWSYENRGPVTQAAFGLTGGAPSFMVRCDRGRRVVSLLRAGGGNGAMTVRTSAGARNLAVQTEAGPPAYAAAALAPGNRVLDEIVFSRGRFAIEGGGAAMLVIPTWPEPARVIEDCRG